MKLIRRNLEEEVGRGARKRDGKSVAPKQPMKDLEVGQDIEMGRLDPADEMNLSKYFEEVNAIKADMKEITNLLLDLQDVNEEMKSTQSYKILLSLRIGLVLT
ncbi:unnamed protein product [Fraxinus pennsylvanica]|uniref:Syntaxin N-terminal domain-containing protein n=1 Tax=Fraxinus pennsylvanica TaxID=56036 RepID=A0AAD1ZFX7_9LAMI|nr:unnamed protein product [Fraxinus pennsylvanica]